MNRPQTQAFHRGSCRIRPDPSGTWTALLQENDGITLATVDGAYVRTTFEVSRSGDRVTLTASVEGGGDPELAREGFELLAHGAAPAAVVVDGVAAQANGARVAIPNAGTAFTVELELSAGALAARG